jgi:hypothetical protein
LFTGLALYVTYGAKGKSAALEGAGAAAQSDAPVLNRAS